jgi:hypothetical protein
MHGTLDSLTDMKPWATIGLTTLVFSNHDYCDFADVRLDCVSNHERQVALTSIHLLRPCVKKSLLPRRICKHN